MTGLLFGSYNPIHKGHLQIAAHILNNTELDEIWFVVSPVNPWKKHLQMPSSELRLKMVEMAIGEHPFFFATNFEEELPRPSYTYESLMYLKSTYPKKQFVLLIGGDNYADFNNWRNAESILNTFPVWAYPREGSQIKGDSRIKLIDAPLLNISSTEIRNRIGKKLDVSHMLHPEVYNFIKTQKLYGYENS